MIVSLSLFWWNLSLAWLAFLSLFIPFQSVSLLAELPLDLLPHSYSLQYSLSLIHSLSSLSLPLPTLGRLLTGFHSSLQGESIQRHYAMGESLSLFSLSAFTCRDSTLCGLRATFPASSGGDPHCFHRSRDFATRGLFVCFTLIYCAPATTFHWGLPVRLGDGSSRRALSYALFLIDQSVGG